MNPSKSISISSIILPSIGVLLVAVVIYGYSRVQANALAVATTGEAITQITPEQIAVATSSAIVDPLPEPATPVVTSVPTPTPVPTPAPVPTPTPQPTTVYKNGTYKASASYATPKVPETINVTLTITNDIVTNATVIEKAISQDSRHYQKTFEANYRAYVVGKNIDSIHLSRVSGSSLTTQGFNSALAIIKSQARI